MHPLTEKFLTKNITHNIYDELTKYYMLIDSEVIPEKEMILILNKPFKEVYIIELLANLSDNGYEIMDLEVINSIKEMIIKNLILFQTEDKCLPKNINQDISFFAIHHLFNCKRNEYENIKKEVNNFSKGKIITEFLEERMK